VEIQNVAREPGYRSKIAVVSHASGVDPVGACVGPRGSRVRMVVSELRGEKIDIIPFNEEPARFVAKALSPARVREVLVDDEAKQATVIVPDDQLSLAIGKDGLNARLAARLTGWRVDIRSETEFAEEEAEMGYQEEEVSGRCAAILANGKRCPNASLPGSRYCGLPAHQALDGTGTDYLVPPEDEGDEETAADGDGAVPEDAGVEVASAEEVSLAEGASENGDLVVEDLVAEDAAEEDAIADDAAEQATRDDAIDEDAVEDAIDEDPVAEAPLEDAVAEPPVDDDPADTSTADQPTDQEPIVDADPVPEDPPEDPDGPVATEADEDLDSDHVAAHDLPSEPIDSETATPDESAADEDES
jgi:N utilization substance protein A